MQIRTALQAETVQVIDVYGDGQHVTIHVVAEIFGEESTMQRQRMVFKRYCIFFYCSFLFNF